jgi:hypothetical protein
VQRRSDGIRDTNCVPTTELDDGGSVTNVRLAAADIPSSNPEMTRHDGHRYAAAGEIG